MFALDPYIIEFVGGNVLALTLFLALLKGIAKLTPTVWDDKISTLLSKVFGLVPKPERENKTGEKGSAALLLLIFMLVFAFVMSCTLSHKQVFLATHKTFNDMVSDYKAYYQMADEETKAKLNKNVTPKVLEALTLSIEINKVVKAGGEASSVDQDRFRELRYELYALLPKIFSLEDK